MRPKYPSDPESHLQQWPVAHICQYTGHRTTGTGPQLSFRLPTTRQVKKPKPQDSDASVEHGQGTPT